jgi:hypothetical protein
MIYKLVNVILRFIVERYILVLLNLFTLVFSIYCLKGMFGFIHFISDMNNEEIDNMNEILDGIAGVFVAIGVLMEERETIQKVAQSHVKPYDGYLNEVAHHNGMGLLLIGLFMELISLMIESPKNIVNTHGIEIYLYIFGFVIILFAALIQIDFIKDYIKTYFKPVAAKGEH